MKFTAIKPGQVDRLFDANPINVATFESDGGLWQVQLNPTYMGSIRLNVSHRNIRGIYLTNYCLGESEPAMVVVTQIVKRIMEKLPEDFDPGEFERMMPDHTVVDDHGHKRWARPIATDPELVRKLCALAGWDGDLLQAALGIICDKSTDEQF